MAHPKGAREEATRREGQYESWGRIASENEPPMRAVTMMNRRLAGSLRNNGVLLTDLATSDVDVTRAESDEIVGGRDRVGRNVTGDSTDHPSDGAEEDGSAVVPLGEDVEAEGGRLAKDCVGEERGRRTETREPHRRRGWSKRKRRRFQ